MANMWFEIEGNSFWLLILDIWDMEIVISGFKKNPPPSLPLRYYSLMYPKWSFPHVLGSILSQSYPYLDLFLGPVLDLSRSYSIRHQICLEEIAFFSSVKYDITVFY